jgi:AraC-like DNA-binding protein
MAEGKAGIRMEHIRFSGSLVVPQSSGYFMVFVEKGRADYQSATARGVLGFHETIASSCMNDLALKLHQDSSAYRLTIDDSSIERFSGGKPGQDPIRMFFSETGTGEKQMPFVIYRQDESSRRIAGLFEAAFEESGSNPALSEYMILAKTIEIIVLLHRSHNARTGKAEPNRTRQPEGIDGVIAAIEANYTDEYSLADLASGLGLTPSYFSHLFHQTAGMPLFEYINTIRIRKACTLLKRTGMSILEIAYAVGYNNLSFFNRYFKKVMNMSPREYKRQK